MPNFKDGYSSQDTYNHRKNIHAHQSLNETENIVEEAVNYCTNSIDSVCFCVYILLFCVIFIGVCVCYFTMPNNEDMYKNYKNYHQRRRKSNVHEEQGNVLYLKKGLGKSSYMIILCLEQEE